MSDVCLGGLRYPLPTLLDKMRFPQPPVVLALTLALGSVSNILANSPGSDSDDTVIGVGPNRPRVDDTVSGPGGGRPLADRPHIRPTRTENPPRIDGLLDDEVWRTSAMITELVQQAPLDGAPATEQSEIYLAYDRDYLYFGFYLHYSDLSVMRANLSLIHI